MNVASFGGRELPRWSASGARHIWLSRTWYAAVLLVAVPMLTGASLVCGVMQAAVLTPLPYRDPDSLVALQFERGGRVGPVTPLHYRRLAEEARAFVALAAIETSARSNRPRFELRDARGYPHRVWGASITPSTFRLLGVHCLFGTCFEGGEPRDGVVLSEPLWRELFDGETVVGTSILLDGISRPVIGIAPKQIPFTYPRRTDLFVLTADPEPEQYALLYEVIGRLRPGVTLEAAQADANRLRTLLEGERPRGLRNVLFRIVPLRRALFGDTRPLLRLLGAAGASIVLLGYSALFALASSRAFSRRRELALRHALGAIGPRVWRSLLIESAVLSLVAFAVSISLFTGAASVSSRLLPADLTRRELIETLPLVVLVACASAVSMAVVLVIPQLRETLRVTVFTTQLSGLLGGSGRRHTRVRKVLLWVQVSVSIALVTTALTAGAGALTLIRAPMGFQPEGIVVCEVALPRERYAGLRDMARFHDAIIRGLRTVPGVENVGVGNTVPLRPPDFVAQYGTNPEPLAEAARTARLRIIDSGYLPTLGVRLLRGRLFEPRDSEKTERVALVNNAFARQAFGERDPLSFSILFGREDTSRYRVVGVVGDVRQAGPLSAPEPGFYLPVSQTECLHVAIVIKGRDVLPSESEVRRVIAEIDPSLPIDFLSSMTSVVRALSAQERIAALLLGVVASLGLVLTVSAVAGLAQHSVATREFELAIRRAVGATPVRLAVVVGRELLGVLIIGAVSGFVLGETCDSLLKHYLSPDRFEWESAQLGPAFRLVPLLAVCGIAGITGAASIWARIRTAPAVDLQRCQ
jgi:putative ABC transport system permease protein